MEALPSNPRRLTPGTYRLFREKQPVLEHCVHGDSWWFNFRGLMGRSSLADDEGILLQPCTSVHMFFMRFALDVVFLDCESRVLRICAGLRPWRISPIVWRSAAVVEMAAGRAAAAGLRVGEQLVWLPAGEDSA